MTTSTATSNQQQQQATTKRFHAVVFGRSTRGGSPPHPFCSDDRGTRCAAAVIADAAPQTRPLGAAQQSVSQAPMPHDIEACLRPLGHFIEPRSTLHRTSTKNASQFWGPRTLSIPLGRPP